MAMMLLTKSMSDDCDSSTDNAVKLTLEEDRSQVQAPSSPTLRHQPHCMYSYSDPKNPNYR